MQRTFQIAATSHLMLKRIVAAKSHGTACFAWSLNGTCHLLREVAIILDRDSNTPSWRAFKEGSLITKPLTNP